MSDRWPMGIRRLNARRERVLTHPPLNTPKQKHEKMKMGNSKRNRADDMLKLERAFFDNLTRNDCEYGGIGLDDKRPFGNSSVQADILELIGAKPEGDNGEEQCWSSAQNAYADELYNSLIDHLQKKYGTGATP